MVDDADNSPQQPQAQPAQRVQPWDRQPDEAAGDFLCFCVFRDLPQGRRSIDRAYRVYTELPEPDTGQKSYAPNEWYKAAKTYKWAERAARYDLARDEWARSISEQRIKETSEVIAENRINHKRNEALVGSLAIERAIEILQHPVRTVKQVVQKIEEKDGKTIVYNITRISKPYRCTMATAALLMKVGSELTRKGLNITEEETDITPAEFASQFFTNDAQLDHALPSGAMPPLPIDRAGKPDLQLPSGSDAERAYTGGGNGNGNGNGSEKQNYHDHRPRPIDYP
jgi:hypothetical protein